MAVKQGIRFGRVRSQTQRRLALDLTEEAVVLFDVSSGDVPQAVGRARLASPDFAGEIDALRIEALIRDPARNPIAIWLPESQVLRRSYLLSSRNRGAALVEAMRRLQDETGYQAEDLAIDLTLGAEGQPADVLAALSQTVREAIEYTQRWGFVPGQVSTRALADGFVDRPPVFALPATRAVNAGKRIVQVAAACVIAIGCGVAGLKLYEVSHPVLKAITVKTIPGHMAAAPQSRDLPATFQRGSRVVIRHQTAQSLPIQGFGVSDHERLKRAGIPEYGQVRRTSKATQPNAPTVEGPMLIGARSDRPSHIRPGRLAALPQAGSSYRITALRAAVDRIRLDSRALAQSSGLQRPKRVTVTETIMAPASAPEPTRDNTATASLMLASVSPAPKTRERAAARAIKADGPAATASLMPKQKTTPVQDDATGSPPSDLVDLPAPQTVSIPLPRPVAVTARVAEQPAPVAVEVNASQETASRAEQSSIADAAETTEPETERVPDPEEAFAALNAPRPVKRPERLRAPETTLPRKTKSKKPISSRASPRSVRSAALERGIDLGETNLIGVLEASSGRRALVRLPGGGFRKVARGDDLNGWRVSSIGRQDMRLTRKGQNRTLLLVSR